jgi:hypothetical protein
MRASDPWKGKLDILVMIMAIFNCFTIPYAISFEPPAFETIAYVIANDFTDVIFLLDLIINCRTTYID